MSLLAAAEVARAAGVTPVIFGDAIEGESREVARVMAGIAVQVRIATGSRRPLPASCCPAARRRSRCAARAAAAATSSSFSLWRSRLRAQPRTFAIAGDTDGVDGAEEIAGALVTPDTLDRARRVGLSAGECLAANDAHGFFEALGDQVVTGPTLTNVNDFRAILVA